MSKCLVGPILAMALLVSAPCFASSIDFTGDGKSALVTIHSPTLGVLSTYAGELDWNWIGAPPPGQAASFYTYCVDPNNYLFDPQQVTLSTTDSMTVAGVSDAGGKAAWLISTYGSSIHQSGTGADAAALQVAIWEAISDNTPNLASGGFTLNGSQAIGAIAQTFLNTLFSGPGGYHTSTALWLDAPAGRGQDQMIGLTQTVTVAAVPEPASLLLCASGLFMVARRIRRRNQEGVAI